MSEHQAACLKALAAAALPMGERRWQTELGKFLGVWARTVRFWIAKDSAPPEVIDYLKKVPTWTPDEFLMASGPNDSGRLYIVRAQKPRFIASAFRVNKIDPDWLVTESGFDDAAKNDSFILRRVIWLDERPPLRERNDLLVRALAFLKLEIGL